MTCKQLLLSHVIVEVWILPRGRTRVGGVGLFCKKLINDTQLQNLFMIFLLGRGNSEERREEEANSQTSDGDSPSWPGVVASIRCL